MIRLLILASAMAAAGLASAGQDPASGWSSTETNGFFNVRNFGAAGDGRTRDTAAFQKALDACAAAGGGTVFVPVST
jgi:polygalacturonase